VVPIWTHVATRSRRAYEQGNRRYDDPLVIHAIHEAVVAVFKDGGKREAVKVLDQHVMDGEFNEKFRQEWFARNAKRRKGTKRNA